ncbi:hypothetical protein D3C78_858350 [compost metagenome]
MPTVRISDTGLLTSSPSSSTGLSPTEAIAWRQELSIIGPRITPRITGPIWKPKVLRK